MSEQKFAFMISAAFGERSASERSQSDLPSQRKPILKDYWMRKSEDATRMQKTLHGQTINALELLITLQV
jgi:hypothetical protein